MQDEEKVGGERITDRVTSRKEGIGRTERATQNKKRIYDYPVVLSARGLGPSDPGSRIGVHQSQLIVSSQDIQETVNKETIMLFLRK